MSNTLLHVVEPKLAPEKVCTSARILVPSDCFAFRALRLEALSGADAKYFGASLNKESAYTVKEWQDICTETAEKGLFGLFAGEKLIGILSAKKWTNDSTGQTLLWGSAYVRRDFRHKHNATELYKLRLNWCLARKQFKRAVMFIREGNATSTSIHLKNGAQYIYSTPMRFADNSAAMARWYEKPLCQ